MKHLPCINRQYVLGWHLKSLITMTHYLKIKFNFMYKACVINYRKRNHTWTTLWNFQPRSRYVILLPIARH